MNYQYLTNTPLEQAVSQYIKKLDEKQIVLQEETISLPEAMGRVSARAIYARLSNPHYNASAMDGIAIRAEDTVKASELSAITLSAAQYTVVDTGDPLPAHRDAVIMMEDVIWEGEQAVIHAPAVLWQHIRQVGEDICAGDMVLPSYTKIDAFKLAALAACGITRVPVLEKIRIAIIPTGDELIPLEQEPKEGDIIEFNSLMMKAMLAEPACQVQTLPIIRDHINELKNALKTAVSQSHMVLINAGSSAGRDDYTSKIIAELGEVCFHGIAIKPGKPTVLGICESSAVIGTPGYPVAAAVVILEIAEKVKDYLLKLFSNPPVANALLSRRYVSGLKYEELVRVRLGKSEKGLIAAPIAGGAGVVTSLLKADALAHIPLNSEGIEAGEAVTCRLLKNLHELDNVLLITGSHDPIIDEIADILRRKNGTRLSSVNEGSMGGIFAIKRGEAHIAPVHLLNAADGSYNTAYIDKYLNKDEVTLLKGIKRIQGLMVAKGNPLHIQGVKDLAGKRYANRPKAAGTRLLLDMLLQKEGIDTAQLIGYDNVQVTHTGVAMAVKVGNADAGMGIYSAAAMMDLDFMPVCEEEYDFIIPNQFLLLPAVQDFIKVLKSHELWERALEMGGYKTYYEG